jgi:hypothetical protein
MSSKDPKDPKDLYRSLLEGRLRQEERDELQEKLELEGSNMTNFIDNRDPDLVEDELCNAYLNAVPKESRLNELSNNEADDLFGKIKPKIDSKLQSLESWRSKRLFKVAGLSFGLGAVAATLVFVLLVFTDLAKESRFVPGKGGIEKPADEQIRLMFNIGKQEKGRPIVIERGIPGDKYRVEHDVLIRYEIIKDGYVCLAHQLPSGQIDGLTKDSSKLIKAGWHDFRVSGRVHGISLADQPGKHVFYGLYSSRPIECPQEADKISKKSYRLDVIVDSFSIEVH